MQRVREVMTRSPIVVRSWDTVETAIALLAGHAYHHLPVVGVDGQLVGMLNAERIAGRGQGADHVEPLMEPVELTARPDDPLLDTVLALVRSPADAAVVVDDSGAPIGLITDHDGVRLAASQLDPELLAHHLRPVELCSAERTQSVVVTMVQMIKQRVHHLVVLSDGELVGVVSYGDLVRAGGLRGAPGQIGPLVEGRDTVTVADGVSVREAAATMAEHRIGSLPVLDPRGRPIRMLTRTDVLDALAASLLEEEVDARRTE
jgi:CBS domain-containing protein